MKPITSERLQAAVIAVVVTVLVAVAVALSLLRVAVNEAQSLRTRIESTVSDLLDVPVRIGHIDARLSGLAPTLVLQDVGVGPTARPVAFDALRFRVDPWRSLVDGGLRLSSVTVEGADLSITNLPRGGLLVEGRHGSLLSRLPVPRHLRLKDFDIVYRARPGATPLHLADINVEITAARTNPSVRGSAQLADFPRSGLVFAAELPSLPDDLGTLGGRVFLRGGNLPLAALRDRLGLSGATPMMQGVADGRVWLTLAHGQLTEAAADGELNSASVGSGPLVQTVQGRVRWRRNDDGWRLDADRLRVQLPSGKLWHSTALSLVRGKDADGTAVWRGSLGRAPLGGLTALIDATAVIPDGIGKRLEAASPTGTLDHAAGEWHGGAEPRWWLRAALTDVATTATPAMPGVRGIDVDLTATPTGGRFRIDGHQAELDATPLFRAPLKLATASGHGAWRRDPSSGDIALTAPRLRAANQDATVSGKLGLWLRRGRAPYIDIHAHLADGDASATSRYLPVGIMHPELIAWLDDAVAGGRIPGADLVLQGPLGDFPFKKGGGVFDIRATFDQGRLAYQAGWPDLEAASGDLHFHGASMRVDVDRARLHGARLTNAVAKIPDLDHARLSVTGGLTGSSQNMLAFLLDSPLDTPAALDRLRLQGSAKLSLALDMPLDDRPMGVDGRVTLNDNRLTLANTDYHVDSLSGSLEFTRDGIQWDGLRGRFDDRPVLSRAWTTGTGKGTTIHSVTRFTAGAQSLHGAHADALRSRVSGRAAWLLTVQAAGFRADTHDLRLQLDSDLKGIAVDAPAPFGKPADRARSLSVETVIGADAKGTEPVSARYGDDLSLVLMPAPDFSSITRLGIRLGGGAPRLPSSDATRVTGRLASVDLAATSVGTALPEGLPPVTALDVTLGRVGLGPAHLTDVSVSGKRQDGGWELGLTGPSVTGTLHVSTVSGRRAVSGRLKRLALQADDSPTTPSADDAPLPSLDLEVASLSVDDHDLGRLQLKLDHRDGTRLRRLLLDGPALRVEASGGENAAAGDSEIKLTADTQDVGKAMRSFGLDPAIKQATGHFQARLSWQGALSAPDVHSLGGTASVTFSNGSLPAVQPGAGRLVGLLSLSLLPRRLGLDFSDVTDKGLTFDRIHGRFQLENGVARPDVFKLEGPVADIDISGPIDLAARRYDQTITVIPKVSSTLPLIGALAGGPQAAIILLLTQKLFQQGVDRMTQFRYRLDGTWADPKLRPIAPSKDTPAAKPYQPGEGRNG